MDYVTHADRGHRFNPPRIFLAGTACIESTSVHVFVTTQFRMGSPAFDGAEWSSRL
jgi:hypothetical protein